MSDDTRPPDPDAPSKPAEAKAQTDHVWVEHRAASGEEEEAYEGLEKAVTAASHHWLKERFSLVEDDKGDLHAPAASSLADFGVQADEFVRGFFRGFFTKSTEELQAARDGASTADFPRGSEVMGRLLHKFSDTVTGVWQGYIAENARTVDGEKRVDGQFAVEHGPRLIASMIEALGNNFGGEGRRPAEGGAAFAGEVMAEQTAEGAPPKAQPTAAPPKIDVKVDFGSILRAVFAATKKKP